METRETNIKKELKTSLNIEPVVQMLEHTMRPKDVVEALTDILMEYAMLIPEEEVRTFKTNVASIYVLINTFREVEKLSNIKISKS